MPLNANIPLQSRPMQMPNFLGMYQQAVQTKGALQGLRERRDAIEAGKQQKIRIDKIMSTKPRNMGEQKQQVMGLYREDPAAAEKLGTMYLQQNKEREGKRKRDMDIMGPAFKTFLKGSKEEQHQNYAGTMSFLEQQGIKTGMPELGPAGMNPDARRYMEHVVNQYGGQTGKVGKFGMTPIYGTNEQGKPVIMRMTEKGIENLPLPEGVKSVGGSEKIDLGDKWGFTDRAGNIVATQPKGFKPGQAAELGLKIDKGGREVKKLDLAIKEDVRKDVAFAQKTDSEKRKSFAKYKKTKQQYQTTLTEMEGFITLADDLASSNLSGITGWTSFRSKFPGKSAAILNKRDRLLSMGTIETMAKLKRNSATGSTGFGALSAPELKVLQDSFAAINNPKLLPKDLAIELNRISKVMKKYKKQLISFEKEYDSFLSPIKKKSTRIDPGKKKKPSSLSKEEWKELQALEAEFGN